MPSLPLIFVFWAVVAAYVVHVIDESLLGGSFVEKVRAHWWPEYSWRKFAWFNAGYFALMIASVVAYDQRGGYWVVLPLAWTIERAANGLWHLWWTLRFREYSPGLLTSILAWMNVYFLIRYASPAAAITGGDAWTAAAIAAAATAFLSLWIPLVYGTRFKGRPAQPHP